MDLLESGASGWVSSVGYNLIWTDGASRLGLARDAPIRASAGSPRHIAALTDTGELTVGAFVASRRRITAMTGEIVASIM